jgi:hypothetical protein
MTWRRVLVCYWRPTDDLPPPGPAPKPLITDHAFDGWTYPRAGKTVCIHWEDGRICDRPEDEHAPTPTGPTEDR